MQSTEITTTKNYDEYWEAQVLTARILQSCGLTVSVRDRLPLFKLRVLVEKRMTGVRRENLLKLFDAMVKLRIAGKEPPFKGIKYI